MAHHTEIHEHREPDPGGRGAGPLIAAILVVLLLLLLLFFFVFANGDDDTDVVDPSATIEQADPSDGSGDEGTDEGTDQGTEEGADEAVPNEDEETQ